jgi:enoyl-CoA hydratase
MDYECILTVRDEAVAIIRLNRPQALNALSDRLIQELGDALDGFEADAKVAVVVITGSEKAFAAGADIKEMASVTYIDAYLSNRAAALERVARFRKPVIAAIAGYCLGGGCELALMCDIVLAADTAKFGQPEITLGIMPGMGGTQRLPRAVGKAKAMEMILTGRMIDAAEAERAGLASRVVPAVDLMQEAIAVAKKVAGYSQPIVMMAKEAVSRAWETPLAEGLLFERRLFHAMFATEDQKEGMAAFVEKRTPRFRNR